MFSLSSLLTVVLSSLSAALTTYLTKKVKDVFGEKSAYGKSIKILMRGQIYEYHKRYTERGYITPKELSEFLEICDLYSAQGGNGTGEKMRKDVVMLPLKEV